VGKKRRRKRVLDLLIRVQLALLGQQLKAVMRAAVEEGYGRGRLRAQA
jgi:hypothetical protein